MGTTVNTRAAPSAPNPWSSDQGPQEPAWHRVLPLGSPRDSFLSSYNGTKATCNSCCPSLGPGSRRQMPGRTQRAGSHIPNHSHFICSHTPQTSPHSLVPDLVRTRSRRYGTTKLLSPKEHRCLCEWPRGRGVKRGGGASWRRWQGLMTEEAPPSWARRKRSGVGDRAHSKAGLTETLVEAGVHTAKWDNGWDHSLVLL